MRPLDAEATATSSSASDEQQQQSGAVPTNSYVLKVGTLEAERMATDEARLAHTATIYVQVADVNDWIPNFEADIYEFRVGAAARAGTLVGAVTAYDQDAKVGLRMERSSRRRSCGLFHSNYNSNCVLL